MKNYSIIRVGNEYVVRAGEASILKVASRRKAARLVTIAAELLNSQILLPADAAPSIAADPQVIACSGVVPDPPDPRVILDPKVIPDPQGHT